MAGEIVPTSRVGHHENTELTKRRQTGIMPGGAQVALLNDLVKENAAAGKTVAGLAAAMDALDHHPNLSWNGEVGTCRDCDTVFTKKQSGGITAGSGSNFLNKYFASAKTAGSVDYNVKGSNCDECRSSITVVDTTAHRTNLERRARTSTCCRVIPELIVSLMLFLTVNRFLDKRNWY